MRHKTLHNIFYNYYWLWLSAFLIISTAAMIIWGVLPKQRQVLPILTMPERAENNGSVYTDSTALHDALYTYTSPIGKIWRNNTLAQIYYHLGRYYELHQNKYEKAAQCYTQSDYYTDEKPAFQSKLYMHTARLCLKINADSLSSIYQQHAHTIAQNANIAPTTLDLTSITATQTTDAALAKRTIEDYLQTQKKQVIIRFLLGMGICTIYMLIYLFFHYYKDANQRLHKQSRQIHTQETQLHQQKDQLQKQKDLLLSQEDQLLTIRQSSLSNRKYKLENHLAELHATYPTPNKNWKNYKHLKKQLNEPLLFLIDKLEQQYPLSEREITFCILYMIYPDMTMPQIADYMNYATSAIRSYKQRIAKKMNIPSIELSQHLIEIALSDFTNNTNSNHNNQ